MEAPTGRLPDGVALQQSARASEPWRRKREATGRDDALAGRASEAAESLSASTGATAPSTGRTASVTLI